MTRKDYVKFADVLKATKPDAIADAEAAAEAWNTWAATVRGIVDIFSMGNQQFDHARFYARIGVDPADVAQ